MGKISLNGDWRLINDALKINTLSNVPGDIANDLFKANLIEDPYYGDNYKNMEFINLNEWTLEKEISLSTQQLANARQDLVIEGIDTYSKIYFNGVFAFETDSMHKTYREDISKFLKEGKNVIKVVLIGIELIKNKISIKPYVSIFDEKRIYIRKAQCHFGWDWAPNLPGLGIYRDIYLDFGAKAEIESCFIKTSMNGDINFKIATTCACDKIKIFFAKYPNTDNCEYLSDFQDGSANNYIVNFKIKDVKLWMPNNYGEQNLYSYYIELIVGNTIVAYKSGKVGIKEVVLSEKAIDRKSLDFCFYINNVKIFCKGSNWIPADCMTGCITTATYEKLLGEAKRANFNMLRVWGGGIYENDLFYDLCDKHGIMVWQDFMFACQDVIDDDDKYVRIYALEAEQQLKRIGSHACITYLCGGNEKTGAFQKHSPQYGNYFLKFVLRGIVENYTPWIPFGVISPYSYTDIDNDSTSGDCHNNVSEIIFSNGNYKKYYENFVNTISNFSSECAVLGPCRLKSLKKFIPENMLNYNDNIFKERFLGNPYTDVMSSFIDRQIALASNMFGDIIDTKDFVKKAMMCHYDIIKAEIDFNLCNGRSNGFLNWMYNDIWPQGTWSVIDYYKTLKPAYYAMKKAFENLRLCFVKTKDETSINLINHKKDDVKVKVEVKQQDYNGKIIQEWFFDIDCKKYCSTSIPICVTPCENTYLVANAEYDGKRLKDICEFERYSGEQSKNNTLSAKIFTKDDKNGEYNIEICSEKFEKAVFIECDDSIMLSDNYFAIENNGKNILKVNTDKPFQISDIKLNSFYNAWDN